MSKTIMVVDDSASVRQVASTALKCAGYDVIEACDGKDALTKMVGQKIHLIVSDLNMPNMDGISLVKQVKSHPQYKFTPFMMLTTESGEGRDMKGNAIGAMVCLVKPFETPELLSAVSRLA